MITAQFTCQITVNVVATTWRQKICDAVLLKDGVELARVHPRTQTGHPWPDRETPLVDMHDLIKALMTTLRHAGIEAPALAQSCSEAGLPMSRSRLDALRGSSPGKRTEVCAAEVVVLLSAAIPLIKAS